MHWHCFTNCPQDANSGNVIDFYMYWQNVDFKTALHALAARAGLTPGDYAPATPAARAPRSAGGGNRVPRVSPPPEDWQHRAHAFVTYAQEQLTTHPPAAKYLQQRGLSSATITAWQLGYNPQALYDEAPKWGLKNNRRVYCAPGIVIPHFYNGAPWFVNIRQLERPPKYLSLRGGRRGMLFGTPHHQGYPLLILCEGEFDALLAWQEAGDLCDILALGGAQNRPAAPALIHLCPARVILAVLDADRAGQQGLATLQQLSPRITTIAPPAHDLTAYWQQGGDLRYWVAQHCHPHLAHILETVTGIPDATYLAWLNQYEQMLAIIEQGATKNG